METPRANPFQLIRGQCERAIRKQIDCGLRLFLFGDGRLSSCFLHPTPLSRVIGHPSSLPAECRFPLPAKGEEVNTRGTPGAIVEVLVICLAPAGFIHRPVPDGSTISFCNRCFATVAVAHLEAELHQPEQSHVCDPYGLEHWKAPSRENRSSNPDQG